MNPLIDFVKGIFSPKEKEKEKSNKPTDLVREVARKTVASAAPGGPVVSAAIAGFQAVSRALPKRTQEVAAPVVPTRQPGQQTISAGPKKSLMQLGIQELDKVTGGLATDLTDADPKLKALGQAKDLIPFIGSIFKKQEDKVTERYQPLIDIGVEKGRATEIAVADTLPAGQRLEAFRKLGVTSEEEKALSKSRSNELADLSLSSLDFVSAGTAKTTAKAIETLAKETALPAIKNILAKDFKGIATDAVEELAQRIQSVTTPQEVNEIINAATKAPESLIEQAKKYKTADEFVEAQGEARYHGTLDEFQPENIQGLGMHFGNKKQAEKVIDQAMLNDEVDPTTMVDINGYQRAKNLVETRLDIKNPAKLVDPGTHSWDPYAIEKQIKDAGYVPKDTVIPIANEDDLVGIKKALQDNGYDGIVYNNVSEGEGESFIAFEPSQIRTTESLKELYTNATKATPASRKNLKLEEMAHKSGTFDAFLDRSGITEEALDSTARAKGYPTARSFYYETKRKPFVSLSKRADEISYSLTEEESVLQSLQGARRYEETPVIPMNMRGPGKTRKAVPAKTPGKIQPVKDSGYTPSVSLVKKIAETEDKFEVLKLLDKEFKNLPDRVKDRFVNKLSRIKRTSDIEGYLRSASDLNEAAMPSKIAPSQKKILDKTLPRSVADVMDDSEKIAYVQNISRKIDDQEQAVLAESEYNKIMEFTDQKVIDRFNNLQHEKMYLQDVIGDDEAGTLYEKYFSRFKNRSVDDAGMQLTDIMEAAQKKSKARRDYQRGFGYKKPAKLTEKEEMAVGLDTEIEALGYKDFDEAQDALDRYWRMRERVKEIEEELAEQRPLMQAAAVLRGLVDDIAVIPTKEVTGIDKLATAADVRDSYKDISEFNTQARDVYRNFRRFFGDKYDLAKKSVLDPFDASKGSFVDSNKEMADDIEASVINKFGFKRGSKESAAIQRYGDTDLPAEQRLSYDQLVDQFGKQKADNIVSADKWFRNRYTEMIQDMNDIRRKIYPNNPQKLISFRKNYYHHYEELENSFGEVLRNFFDSPAGINPKLAGISENTKPKSRFLPFAEQRTGQKTELDAIGGFLKYTPMYSYAVHIDPQISKFRYLRQQLASNAPKKGQELPLLDELGAALPGGQTFQHKGVENFLIFLDRFTNDLSGKTGVIDRLVQETIPGGRTTLRALDWVNNRIKANTILGNLGSAVAQLANVPLGMAKAKQYSAPGMARTLASLNPRFRAESPIGRSTFIKERYAESLEDRFPFQFSDRPVTATVDEGRKKLAYILQAVDRVGTEFIWNSMLEKHLAENVKKLNGTEIWKNGLTMDDAVRYADSETRALVGGRGIGEVPLGQKSKLFQIVAPFQLEVGNLWHVLDDATREYYKGAGNKDLSFLLYYSIGAWMYNEASEATRGSRVVFDPINSLVQGTQSLIEESKEGNYGLGAMKFVGRQAGEVLSNMPLGQTVATTLVPSDARKTLFGQADPARFGEVPLLPQTGQKVITSVVGGVTGTGQPLDDLADAGKNILSIVLPYGSKQIEKMYGGFETMLSGTMEDGTGKLSTNVKPTIENWVRAVLFGKNATTEARKLFKERDDAFKVLDRQEISRKALLLEAEDEWGTLQKINKTQGKDAAEKAFAALKEEDPALAKKVREVAKTEKKGLNGSDRIILMMGVENGERAKFLVSQLKEFKTVAERNAYAKELQEKGLLSKEVKKQIRILWKD